MAPPRMPSGKTAGMANILMPMYVRKKVQTTNHQLYFWYACAHLIMRVSAVGSLPIVTTA
eukprot:scaffold108014_cov48-Phaeocystis_antarctica.AAC.3